MKTLSLNGSDWTLRCYWQNQWRLDVSADQSLKPALPIIPATVPGSVHADLLAGGLIEDWQDGLSAAKCEWINNRDWAVQRTVTVPEDFDGKLTLECAGLDYSGHVLINNKVLAPFEGTHVRHRFDLAGHVVPGETFELTFIFDFAPQVDGVFGHTSKITDYKPRFGYYWDWCPRLVNVGIWQDVRLVSRGPTRLERCYVSPRVRSDLASGYVRVTGRIAGDSGGGARLRCRLDDDAGDTMTAENWPIHGAEFDFCLDLDRVHLWWPASMGKQPLYRVTVELVDEAGHVSDLVERTVGFKRVRWLPNEGAPSGAKPYTLEINGQKTFLRGVNWVPISPVYGDVTTEQYETFLKLYRHMNVNLIRVWGGGILEKTAFYEWCDRLGLLVWQEFPLSSSGIDNWPPEDPAVMDELEVIAAEFIERRGHHASHLMWCGGNELQGALDGGKVGLGRPVDETHPLMSRWQRLVERLDPGKRFQASSPSGPRFYAYEGDFGKSIHHQTHGPWGNRPLSERYSYFNDDDSLFRSETGACGCASMAELERHKGDQSLWPPRDDNPHWLVPASHWIPWEDVEREFGPLEDDPAQFEFIVKASRYLQAESYRYIAEATRRGWPRCSGFLIWMGHDSVHCTSNNSVIQIDASAKPAYDWLQQAWADRHVSLRHDAISYAPGDRLTGEVWIHRDDVTAAASGEVSAQLRSLDGQMIETTSGKVNGQGGSIAVVRIDWAVPELPEKLFIVELVWQDGDATTTNRYLLSQQAECPLAPMRDLAAVSLAASRDGDRVFVRNDGDVAAIAVRVTSAAARQAILTDRNNLILLPGEEATVAVEALAADWVRDDGKPPCVAIECFNGETVLIGGD